MGSEIIQITYLQVALGYIFILIVLLMIKKRGISREKELVVASIRMTFQLVLVGFLLAYIIENPHPIVTFLIVLIMISFSVYTIIHKFKSALTPALKRIIVLSMFFGTIPVILYFLWLVIQIEPYYNPQYFIPITGMIVGNSMTGISLGVHTLTKRFTDNKNEIEESLILGASPKEASSSILNDSFDAAILPTLNSMLGMGIIFLPGMMTGQILSGVSPTLAILYQIAVMLGILGGVSVTTYIFLHLGYKTYFNAQAQLNN
ncbi:ABC transporter permease [Liberiplasma polymorphum]|jgi:putative ABC transport system permease protein|uniref:ABC transporter permease n=1 Tax=Liberiplasma polymorphum TaxID=3374570 RepID=UPI003774455E